MRETLPFTSLAAGGLTAFALVATIFLSTDGARAIEPANTAAERPGALVQLPRPLQPPPETEVRRIESSPR